MNKTDFKTAETVERILSFNNSNINNINNIKEKDGTKMLTEEKNEVLTIPASQVKVDCVRVSVHMMWRSLPNNPTSDKNEDSRIAGYLNVKKGVSLTELTKSIMSSKTFVLNMYKDKEGVMLIRPENIVYMVLSFIDD